jgi:acyl carrier protein
MITVPSIEEATSIVAGVLHRIAPEVDLAALDPDEDLASACDLDSMDFLSLVEGVSSIVHRDIPERDYPRVASMSGFAQYLVDPAGQ